MNELVIGSDGFIGARLMAMAQCEGTTRRSKTKPEKLHFDLLDMPPQSKWADKYHVYYLCAGANGAKRCEGSQNAFVANVDAPIAIAKAVKGFVVYVSSMSVEWMDGAYQRQKLAAETVLRTMPNVGIVRAGRVVNSNVDDLCKALLEVGRGRLTGVTRWGTDEIAYQK